MLTTEITGDAVWEAAPSKSSSEKSTSFTPANSLSDLHLIPSLSLDEIASCNYQSIVESDNLAGNLRVRLACTRGVEVSGGVAAGTDPDAAEILSPVSAILKIRHALSSLRFSQVTLSARAQLQNLLPI
ncbi:hypothetical protein Pcinc_012375 [Petrolisthes cinctipes]|uniref:Uncharacterized protein n=1 Tax=Petrolisthes cinctipes TaxID=88211 RepID=A0AAE1G0X4_PETCI|nr:hypothetical protein Pcinc_012375 [Petrolisthes cinctipes]